MSNCRFDPATLPIVKQKGQRKITEFLYTSVLSSRVLPSSIVQRIENNYECLSRADDAGGGVDSKGQAAAGSDPEDRCKDLTQFVSGLLREHSGESRCISEAINRIRQVQQVQSGRDFRKRQLAYAAGFAGRSLILSSTREPSRLIIDIRRSTVNRPSSALRIREKSAAAIPVRSCAARTLSRCRSSALMISAARIALNCSTSASSCPRSRKTFPDPRTTSSLSDFIPTSPSVYSNDPGSDRRRALGS